MREGYIFYISFYEAIRELSDKDRLALYDAINEYSLYGNMPELTGVPKAVFTLIKPQIDANQKRYDNGKKGGRPRQSVNLPETESKSNENQDETKNEPTQMQNVGLQKPTRDLLITEPEANDKEKVKDNVNDKENLKGNVSLSAKRGVPAAGEDTEKFRSAVLKVFFFRNLIDPMAEVDKFFAHYAKTGWADGNGNPIRDIPAAAQCWEQKVPKSNVRRPFAADFVEAWRKIYDEVSELLPGTDITPLLEIRAVAIDSKKQETGLKVTPALDAFIRTHPDIQPVFRKYINSRVKWGIVK